MSTIRIKRSTVAGNPGTLAAGELAYSGLTDNGSNGGDRLYIGLGTETGGNAANHFIIGGKYYTDLMSGTAGTLTTSSKSVPILSATGTIDKWYAGNLYLSGDTITTTDTNGNLILNANGTGKISFYNAYTFPRTDGTANYVLTTNGSGVVSWAAASSNLSIAGTSGTGTIALTSQSLTVTGTNGISASATNQTITVSFNTSTLVATAVLATTATSAATAYKVANALTIGTGLSGTSYDGSAGVTVAIDGTVATTSTAQILTNKTISASSNTIQNLTNSNLSGTAGITNANLQYSSVTVGSTAISLGASSTTLAGLTQVDINNVRITGNTISATNTHGNLNLNSNGTGTIVVNNVRITNLADPSGAQDAATKNYVDTIAQGLHTHAPVAAATTQSLALITGGSVTYDNGTAGVGATLTLGVALTVVDGYTVENGDRLLIKNEATTATNGIYTWATGGTVLTRATDFNSTSSVAGGDFVFVVHGVVNGDTGWVETEKTTAIGTSPILFVQFSSAGSYEAGNGLALNGNIFSISAGYVGQSSITTVGTIGSGIWNGTAVARDYGGTGVTSYSSYDLLYGTTSGPLGKLAIGTAGQVLQVNTSGSALIYGDIDGGTY
jgi:hypothetical protein